MTQALAPPDEPREKLLAARRNAYALADAKAAEGQRILEVNCGVCHQFDGKGGLVGPQLTGIGNRGVERLCEDILDPNRNVDHAFATTTLTLKETHVRWPGRGRTSVLPTISMKRLRRLNCGNCCPPPC